MWHSWEGILCDRFRVRRGGLGRGIYGALDLDRFGVRDIVGRKLDGTSGKGCEKGLGEREFGHGESKRGVLRYSHIHMYLYEACIRNHIIRIRS